MHHFTVRYLYADEIITWLFDNETEYQKALEFVLNTTHLQIINNCSNDIISDFADFESNFLEYLDKFE